MSKPRLMIATPMHDHRCNMLYVLGIVHTYLSGKFDLDLVKVGGAGIARARNNCVALFKKSGREKLFWIDSDIRFLPQHVERLVNHCTEAKPIIGGLYTHKTRELIWCIDRADLRGPDMKTGLQFCDKIGTGFMCTHRSVYEKMEKAFPEMAYIEDLAENKGEPMFAYFVDSVFHDPGFGARGRYLTEDWYFCWRAKQLGLPIYIDTTFWLTHEGLFEYPMQKPELLARPREFCDPSPLPPVKSEEQAVTMASAADPTANDPPAPETTIPAPRPS